METAIKEIIENLKKHIGMEIIRISPVPIAREEWESWKGLQSDWRHTRAPIILLGFTEEGCIRYRYNEEGSRTYGGQEEVLPLCFTDENWIPYEEALQAKDNELNKWIGRKIRRVRPTSLGDRSYMYEDDLEKVPTLISASKYHMVISENMENFKSKLHVLGPTFVHPEDWQLAE